MSASELGEACLDLPEKPPETSIDDIANVALGWVLENLPYENNGIYRPELAAERGGGNCYAQALACVSLLDAWEIPSGIVLNDDHAHVVMLFKDHIRFIDPFTSKKIRDVPAESDARAGNEEALEQHYLRTLNAGLVLGIFSIYFYQKQVGEDSDWHAYQPATIRGGTVLTERNNPHIIVDARQGYQMLCAIGDLARYTASNGGRFPDEREKERDELIDLVPDFIDPLTTITHTVDH